MLTDGRTTDAGVTGILIAHLGAFGSGELKKEGQESLIRSSEFCLKLTYTYPLKASHVPGTPGAGPNLALWHNLNKLGRGLLGHSTYQISRLSALWFQTRRFFHGFPYISLSKTCDPWNRAIMAPGE